MIRWLIPAVLIGLVIWALAIVGLVTVAGDLIRDLVQPLIELLTVVQP